MKQIIIDMTTGAIVGETVDAGYRRAGMVVVPAPAGFELARAEDWSFDGAQVILGKQAIIISPVEFKLLWKSPERIALKAARAANPIIEDFYELLDDPRLKEVNLSLQSTKDAVGYLLSVLVTAGVLAEADVAGRLEELLSGVFL